MDPLWTLYGPRVGKRDIPLCCISAVILLGLLGLLGLFELIELFELLGLLRLLELIRAIRFVYRASLASRYASTFSCCHVPYDHYGPL